MANYLRYMNYKVICCKQLVTTCLNLHCFSVACKINKSFSTGRRNFYDVLEITPKASTKDIKKAYFKLSKIYHPDVNKGNDDAIRRFREITEAYEVLMNSLLRKEYDKNVLSYSGPRATTAASKEQSPPNREFTGAMYDYDEWVRQHYEKNHEKADARPASERTYDYPDEERSSEWKTPSDTNRALNTARKMLSSFIVLLMTSFFSLHCFQNYYDVAYDEKLSLEDEEKKS